MAIGGVQVTFDAHDPGSLAAFWGEALGYTEQPPPPGFGTWEDFGRHMGLPEERWGDFAALVDPDGVGPRLFFQRVPEGKAAKNRMHLDLNVGAEVADPSSAARWSAAERSSSPSRAVLSSVRWTSRVAGAS